MARVNRLNKRTRALLAAGIFLLTLLPALGGRRALAQAQSFSLTFSGSSLQNNFTPFQSANCTPAWSNNAWRITSGCGTGGYGYNDLALLYTFPNTYSNITIDNIVYDGSCAFYGARIDGTWNGSYTSTCITYTVNRATSSSTIGVLKTSQNADAALATVTINFRATYSGPTPTPTPGGGGGGGQQPEEFTLDFTGDELGTWTPVGYGSCPQPIWVTATNTQYGGTGYGPGTKIWFQAQGCDGPNNYVRIAYTFPQNFTDIYLRGISVFQPNNATANINGIELSGSQAGSPNVNITNRTIYVMVNHTPYFDTAIYRVVLTFRAVNLPFLAVNPPYNEGSTGVCKLCSYAPSGNWIIDAISLINYLACQINNVWFCIVIPLLLGIWRTILNILLFGQSVMNYSISGVGQVARWMNVNTMIVVRYGSGFFQNGINQLTNAIALSSGSTIIQQGGSGTNLFDALISFFGAVKDVVASVSDVVKTIVVTLPGVLGQLANLILQLAFLLLNAIILLLNVGLAVLNQIFRFLTLIPEFIGAFSQGLNTTLTNPLAPAIVGYQSGTGPVNAGNVAPPPATLTNSTLLGQSCSSDPMFSLCLGVWVIDNTLFAPAPNSGFSLMYFLGVMKALAMLALAAWFIFKKLVPAVRGALNA